MILPNLPFLTVDFSASTDSVGSSPESIPVANLEDMPIPTVVGVTNFDSGKPEAFRKGSVSEAVAASCSIPIVFQPAVINNTRYVDGGLLHNLPAWAIRDECKILIGINCSPVESPRHKSQRPHRHSYTHIFNLVAKSNAVPIWLCATSPSPSTI